MSTISNERLESLQRQFKEEGFNDIRDSEVMQLVEENLALRKERERAEPVVVPDLHKVVYHFRDLNEGFPVERFKADYVISRMLANYPPAPSIADDSLPYDPQIAEYEQMMEAEQAQADTTSQQFESLAGKAVSGWIPCSERMPEEMVDVLVTDGEEVKGMWWNGRGWDSWDDRYALDSDDVTHWQPLSEPPCK